MKTKLILGCALFLFSAGKASSQILASNSSLRKDFALQAMKDVRAPHRELAAGPTISKKLQRSFHQSFPDVQKASVSILGKEYLYTFTDGRFPIYAVFGKRGFMFYSVEFSCGENLPDDLKQSIADEYPDYTIAEAAEVKTYDQDIWVVDLKKDEASLTLRIENDAMEEVPEI